MSSPYPTLAKLGLQSPALGPERVTSRRAPCPSSKKSCRDRDGIHAPAADRLWADLQLDPKHAEELQASGLSPEAAADRGVRSIHDPAELAALDFALSQRRVPGLLLPLHGLDGEPAGCQYKPDSPRPDRKKPGKVIKYENIQGARMLPDVPRSMRAKVFDVAVPLVFTEGLKKVDAAASAGICAVSVGGVWNWKPDHAQAELVKIPLDGRRVLLVFDGDFRTNDHVMSALQAFASWLTKRGAVVSVVTLPDVDGLQKTGLDDFLVNRTASGEPNHPELVIASLEALAVPMAELANGSVKIARPTDRQTVEAALTSQEAREAFSRLMRDLDDARDDFARLNAVKAADDQRNGAFFKAYRVPKQTPAIRTALAVVNHLGNVPMGTWRWMPNKLTGDLAGKSENIAIQHWAAIAPALVGIVETEKQWCPKYQQPTTRRRLLVPVADAIAAIEAYVDRATSTPTATAPDLMPVVIHTDRRTYRAEDDGGELIAETHTRRRTTRPRPAMDVAASRLGHQNRDLRDDGEKPSSPPPVVVPPMPIGHQNRDLSGTRQPACRTAHGPVPHRLPNERVADATVEHRSWQATNGNAQTPTPTPTSTAEANSKGIATMDTAPATAADAHNGSRNDETPRPAVRIHDAAPRRAGAGIPPIFNHPGVFGSAGFDRWTEK